MPACTNGSQRPKLQHEKSNRFVKNFAKRFIRVAGEKKNTNTRKRSKKKNSKDTKKNEKKRKNTQRERERQRGERKKAVKKPHLKK